MATQPVLEVNTTADIPIFNGSVPGLVPATNGADPQGFLKVDGKWHPTPSFVLTPTGVTAGTYGDSTHVGRFTVNANGLLTAASSVAISASVVPLTTLGDTLSMDATPTLVRVAGNTTAVRQYYSQTGTGSVSAVPAWVNAPRFNVRDYGAIINAVGAQIATNTTAIQTAITAACAVSGCVYFPAGLYIINAALTTTAGAGCIVSFKGDGSRVSIIQQNTAAANGLFCDLSSGNIQQNMVHVMDLCFQANAACGTAIKIDYGSNVNNEQAVGSIVERVQIKGTSLFAPIGWIYGIETKFAWHVRIRDVYFMGAGPSVWVTSHAFIVGNVVYNPVVAGGGFVAGKTYQIVTIGSTDYSLIGAAITPVSAGAFVVSTVYTIKSIGSTDFTLIGAASNTVGLSFTASGVGTGSGTAWKNSTTVGVVFLSTGAGSGSGTATDMTAYYCLTAHTSGTFSTDLAAGKWQQWGGVSTPGTGANGPSSGAAVAFHGGVHLTCSNCCMEWWSQGIRVDLGGIAAEPQGMYFTEINMLECIEALHVYGTAQVDTVNIVGWEVDNGNYPIAQHCSIYLEGTNHLFASSSNFLCNGGNPVVLSNSSGCIFTGCGFPNANLLGPAFLLTSTSNTNQIVNCSVNSAGTPTVKLDNFAGFNLIDLGGWNQGHTYTNTGAYNRITYNWTGAKAMLVNNSSQGTSNGVNTDVQWSAMQKDDFNGTIWSGGAAALINVPSGAQKMSMRVNIKFQSGATSGTCKLYITDQTHTNILCGDVSSADSGAGEVYVSTGFEDLDLTASPFNSLTGFYVVAQQVTGGSLNIIGSAGIGAHNCMISVTR